MNNKNLKKHTIIITMMIIVVIIIGLIYSIQIGNKTDNTKIIVPTSTGSNILKTEVKTNIGNTSTKLEIINHQLLYGREEVLSLDCSKISDIETKNYCIDEQEEINMVSKSVSWEQVLNKGDEYIITFDCNAIYSDIGKKYCIEHQNILFASK